MEIPEGAITSFRGQYKFLSNFAYSPFTVKIQEYHYTCKTVEHFFQASKCYDHVQVRKIINAATPRQAKTLGRNVELVDNWDEIKNDVMLDGLRAKFNSDYGSFVGLGIKLLLTGDRYLIEGNTWNDRYWGATIQGNRAVGFNWLGQLLMKVRDELRGTT
jgi:ribA/ribD-fused uncharacterized protein